MNAQTLIANVAELVKTKLKPIVDDIDRKGYYPEAFMRELGAIGGFGAVGTEAEGGNGLGLATQIAVLRESAKNAAQPPSARGVRRLARGICTKRPTKPSKTNTSPTSCKAKYWRVRACPIPSNTLPASKNTTSKLSEWRAATQSTARCRGCPTSAKTTSRRIPPKSATVTLCLSPADNGKA